MDQLARRPEEPVLLLTKLHPPVVPAQTIARERLFERLRDGRGRRLSLVACPAGFGKSTLLAAWREREAGARPVAWVTLDDGDDDAVVLWSHAIEALGRACPDARRTRRSRRRPRPRRCSRWRCRGSSTRSSTQGEVVLVLDDFHRLSSRPSRESVAWFVDHLPATVQLVLSTRADPALPLGALRAHGELLGAAGGRPALHARGGGRVPQRPPRARSSPTATSSCSSPAPRAGPRASTWPRCRSPTRTTRPGSCAAFDGTSAHVVDFLVERGARRLRAGAAGVHAADLGARAAVRAAVRRGPRRAASRRPRSTSLARTNLFLLPLDDQRRWFRFHHLFAQLLRVELERREPELVAELHRRAYVWHCESGTTDEAIHHAVAAGAFAEAGRADRGDLGPLRQRRPDVVGARLAACASPRRCSAPTGGCCW